MDGTPETPLAHATLLRGNPAGEDSHRNGICLAMIARLWIAEEVVHKMRDQDCAPPRKLAVLHAGFRGDSK
jgi:hypothetical protein